MNNEIIYNEIGKLIKKERKKKGITQEKLANLTSYSLSFIANIESNTHQSFSIHTLYNIANVLEIPVYRLLPTLEEIKPKHYQLVCTNCKYFVDIPKEIGKLIENSLNLINEKATFTCPNCKMKKVTFKT